MAMKNVSVRSILAKLTSDRPDELLNQLADDVRWTVLGTHPLAGCGTSNAAYLRATFPRLRQLFKAAPGLCAGDILVDGDKAVMKLRTSATAKRGGRFQRENCGFYRFENERIVEVREYLDSARIVKIIEQGEVQATP
jgi:hypothetical protein